MSEDILRYYEDRGWFRHSDPRHHDVIALHSPKHCTAKWRCCTLDDRQPVIALLFHPWFGCEVEVEGQYDGICLTLSAKGLRSIYDIEKAQMMIGAAWEAQTAHIKEMT